MERTLTALRAAGEQTRLRLLAILAQGELTVKELTQILGQSQPRVSRHLKLLTESGLVVRYPEGSWVFYRLCDTGEGARLGHSLVDLLPQNDPVLLRDLARLKRVRQDRAKAAQSYFSANAANWNNLRALHIADTHIEDEILALVARHAASDASSDAPQSDIGTLVDLGTGSGRMLELLGPQAQRCIGFDVNADMLALARSNLNADALRHCQVRMGDILSLPLAENVADVIIMHQVLHFLEDPTAAINEAARVLAPDGLLLIADFAPHNVENLRDAHAHRRLGFTDAEIGNMLAEAGLDAGQTRELHADNNKPNLLSVYLWSARLVATSASAPRQKKLRQIK